MKEEKSPTVLEAKLLKALSNPTRLRILEFLRTEEKCQCEILPFLKRSQSTVAEHLKKLEKAGVLKSRRDGRRILYRIQDDRIVRILDLTNELALKLKQG